MDLEILKTNNEPDSTSKILEAAGDMATDAPIFKGLGTVVKKINIGINGKQAQMQKV